MRRSECSGGFQHPHLFMRSRAMITPTAGQALLSDFLTAWHLRQSTISHESAAAILGMSQLSLWAAGNLGTAVI